MGKVMFLVDDYWHREETIRPLVDKMNGLLFLQRILKNYILIRILIYFYHLRIQLRMTKFPHQFGVMKNGLVHLWSL